MFIFRLLPLVPLLLLASLTVAQTSPPATPSAPLPASTPAEPEKLPPSEADRRNALLRPGLAKLNAGDAAGAFEAFGPALTGFPDDLRVLRFAAQAAFFSNHNQEALDLFTRALAQHPYEPWPLRLARLQAEARLARWEDFEGDLAELRTAKKSYTDHQLDSSTGFLIDTFRLPGADADASAAESEVQIVVFPLQSDRYHTLFRFLLPKQAAAKVSMQAGVNSDQKGSNSEPENDRCKNPNFRPYIDLESDDVDQAAFKQAHPDLAAKGERSFSLDTYPGPCSQGLIKFYPEGEPRYELVRADILKVLAKSQQPKSGEPPTR